MSGRQAFNFDEINQKSENPANPCKIEHDLVDEKGRAVTYCSNNDEFLSEEEIEANGVDSFIMLTRRDTSLLVGELTIQDQPEGGWKFHISLLENPENLKKAWDIVKDILINYRIACFKVVKNPAIPLDIETQGKEITIYACADPQKDIKEWREILRLITIKFVAEGVKPGYQAYGCIPVSSSPFFTYRNDRAIGSTSTAIAHGQVLYLANPFFIADPFFIEERHRIEHLSISLKMDVANQGVSLQRDLNEETSKGIQFGVYDKPYHEIREEIQEIQKALDAINNRMPLPEFIKYRQELRSQLAEIYSSSGNLTQKLESIRLLKEALNKKLSELKSKEKFISTHAKLLASGLRWRDPSDAEQQAPASFIDSATTTAFRNASS